MKGATSTIKSEETQKNRLYYNVKSKDVQSTELESVFESCARSVVLKLSFNTEHEQEYFLKGDKASTAHNIAESCEELS